MIDEKEWEEMIDKLIRAKERIAEQKLLMENDMNIKWLEIELVKYRGAYLDQINEHEKAVTDYTNALINLGASRNNEMLRVGRHTVTWRQTKSMIVKGCKGIVELLIKIDKVEAGVKSFSLPFLRKLADSGILPEIEYAWEYKHTPIIKSEEKA